MSGGWGRGAVDVGCRVYNSSDQTAVNATYLFPTFNAEEYDTHGFHSTSSNTSRITIPAGQGGKYLIGAGAAFGASSVGQRLINIVKNRAGTAVDLGFMSYQAHATNTQYMHLVVKANLVETDYVEVGLYQNSGGDLTALAARQYALEFWCQKIDKAG